LAGAFPNVSFSGLELTETGHAAAKLLQEEPELPQHLVEYAPLSQIDRQAHRRISFTRGDATHMPFDNDAFDLVFTVLSVGLNVISRDYYRGSIQDLAEYGLEPIWATADFPQELMLGSCLVLSRKTTDF
jgi:hypothetical protein